MNTGNLIYNLENYQIRQNQYYSLVKEIQNFDCETERVVAELLHALLTELEEKALEIRNEFCFDRPELPSVVKKFINNEISSLDNCFGDPGNDIYKKERECFFEKCFDFDKTFSFVRKRIVYETKNLYQIRIKVVQDFENSRMIEKKKLVDRKQKMKVDLDSTMPLHSDYMYLLDDIIYLLKTGRSYTLQDALNLAISEERERKRIEQEEWEQELERERNKEMYYREKARMLAKANLDEARYEFNGVRYKDPNSFEYREAKRKLEKATEKYNNSI